MSPPCAISAASECACRRRSRSNRGVRPPRGGGGSPWFVLGSRCDRQLPSATPAARSPARGLAGGCAGVRAAVSGTSAHRSHRTNTRGNVCRSLRTIRRPGDPAIRRFSDSAIQRGDPHRSRSTTVRSTAEFAGSIDTAPLPRRHEPADADGAPGVHQVDSRCPLVSLDGQQEDPQASADGLTSYAPAA